MINIEHYLNLVDSIGGIDKINELNMVEGHEMIQLASRGFTDQSALDRVYSKSEYRVIFDKYIDFLSNQPRVFPVRVLTKEEAYARKKAKSEKDKTLKPKAEKKLVPTVIEKKAVKKNVEKVKPNATEHFYDYDIKMIRAFLMLVKQKADKTKLTAFFKRTAKQNTEKRFTHSKYKPLLNQIVKLVHGVISGENDKMVLKHEFLDELTDISQNHRIIPSVQILKRFYNYIGKFPEEKQVHALIKAAEKIPSTDRYHFYVAKALFILKEYLKKSHEGIQVDEAAINGLSGILSECGCKVRKPAKKNNGVSDMPLGYFDLKISGNQTPDKRTLTKVETPRSKVITRNQPTEFSGLGSIESLFAPPAKHNVFQLDGVVGKWFGKMERYKNTIIIHGRRYIGKSNLLYDLMNSFAGQNWVKRIAHFSLEEGNSGLLIDKRKSTYFSPLAYQKVSTAAEAPNGIETIRQAAKIFDVIAVDSFTSLQVPQLAIEELRQQFPNVIFIWILQSTTQGNPRGGSSAGHNAPVEIKVEADPENPSLVYARFEKNRYWQSDEPLRKYNFFKRKLL